MTNEQPATDDWRKLYEAAIRLKEASPWQWMDETDIFGVQDPETGRIGFISVMGSLGEHFAIAVYLDNEGLNGFWNIYAQEKPMGLEAFFDLPQLQVSFENRDFLEKEDLGIIKRLELKFHGRNAWPLFRSCRPGFYPWFLEAHEVTFLTHALEQTLDVVLRFREDESLIYPEDGLPLYEQPEITCYLVRTPRREGDSLTWEDSLVSVPPPAPLSFSVEIDPEKIITVKSMPVKKTVVEMDFFLFPIRIGQRGTRPSIPHLLMMVDSKSGIIIGNEFLEAKPSKAEMYGNVPEHIIDQMIQSGSIPGVIKVRSELLHDLLTPLSKEFGFKLVKSPVLKNLDAAREAMIESLV